MLKSNLPKESKPAQFVDVKIALRTPRQIRAAELRAMRATRVVVLQRPSLPAALYGPQRATHSSPRCWTTSVKTTMAPTGTCDARDCEQPALRRIAVNIHGCVYECDVCARHAQHHGHWIDDL